MDAFSYLHSTASVMMSHRKLITAEYLKYTLPFCLLICLCTTSVKGDIFMQIFIKYVERLNSPVYSAPPCRILDQVLSHKVGENESNL